MPNRSGYLALQSGNCELGHIDRLSGDRMARLSRVSRRSAVDL